MNRLKRYLPSSHEICICVSQFVWFVEWTTHRIIGIVTVRFGIEQYCPFKQLDNTNNFTIFSADFKRSDDQKCLLAFSFLLYANLINTDDSYYITS